jgi:hypothetical protein
VKPRQNLQIFRRVLLAENVRCRNTTTRSAADQPIPQVSDKLYHGKQDSQRASHTPLHLPNNVVMHIAQQTRHVTVGTTDTQKDPRIACCRVRREPHHGNANDCSTGIPNDDDTTLAVVVGQPGRGEHPHGRNDVRWEGENLGKRDGVAHVVAEDYGKEAAWVQSATFIGKAGCCVRESSEYLQTEGICHYIVEEVQPSELPDLEVPQMAQDQRHSQLVNNSIASVSLDAIDHNRGFGLGQEGLSRDDVRLRCLIREVDNEHVAHKSQDASDSAFDGKDPLPAIEACFAGIGQPEPEAWDNARDSSWGRRSRGASRSRRSS